MSVNEKEENKVTTIEDSFVKTVHRFSTSLSDLREFSELVETLIATHKLKELESALSRYHGLEEALCHFDSNLKSDIEQIRGVKCLSNEVSESRLKIDVDKREDGKNVLTAQGHIEDIKEFDKHISSIFRTESSVKHLQRSSLISLVSIAESFISQVLHLFYERHPGALNGKDKQFTFEELSNFSTIDEAKSYLVGWKIENLLRGSFEDWVDYFNSQIKLDLSITKKHYQELVENFQRRNLLVHNDGVVNKIYLSKVSPAFSKHIGVGQKLDVTKDYLFSAIDRFESSFLQLGYELWAKCEKMSEKRPTLIVQSGYRALEKSRWNVAVDLSEIAEKDRSSTEIDILMAKFNCWIARRSNGDREKVIEEVTLFDASAKDDLFKMAKHCLLGEVDGAISHAKELEKVGKIRLSDLKEWPLFSEIRDDERVAALISELTKKAERMKRPKRSTVSNNSSPKINENAPIIGRKKPARPSKGKASD